MAQFYRIKLRHLHEKTGLSAYMVAKKTGIAENTVRKYVAKEYVDRDYFGVAVAQLAEFYGADWRNPDIVEFIDDTEGRTLLPPCTRKSTRK